MHTNFKISMKLKEEQLMQGPGILFIDPLIPHLRVSDGSESEAPCRRRAIVLVNLKHPFIVGGGAGAALGMERSSLAMLEW